MREYMGLYRGKRVDNGEWVEGSLFLRKDTTGKVFEAFIVEDAYEQIAYWQIYIRSNLKSECYRIDIDTVGECTGLPDKNGNLIFEGDIVRQHGLKWLVGYQRGAFACIDEKNEMFFAFFEQYDFYKGEYRFPDTFEIIGNIHDNPELLGSEG